ncbi:MAG TPA: hypothetical protein VK272_04450 [Solirubrobacteraceae bacterium]|nr:hypothetical protein [Solirubrobacteraceae bacterium]HLM85422.1 hypothetical protein [Solirubrobacteraceae bacterium]
MRAAAAATFLLAAGACAWSSATARAQASAEATGGPAVVLTAAFSPDRLGAATAISFGVRIDPPAETGPVPLAGMEVSYPTNLGLATSGLGLEACDPGALEVEGPSACPPDSKMGRGSAVVEVPFGPNIVTESVTLDIYAAPSSDGYLHLAILAHGSQPVVAQIVLSGVLLPGRLEISVPPIVGVPGAPYAAVVDMHATLGGALTYYEHARGRTIAYRPKGIGLPDSCPRGGFKLGASLAFTDGQSSAAGTVVPCPRGRRATRR